MSRKTYTTLLNILLPLRCIDCGRYDALLCPHCLASIRIRPDPVVQKPTQYLDFCIVSTTYQNPTIKAAIRAYKYAGCKDLAQPLSQLMLHALKRYTADEVYTIIAVPLHKRKEKIRGYNQSMLLAERIAIEHDMPHDAHLKRIRFTPSQSKLNRVERLKNIENSFRYHGRRSPEHILLIDDIATTFSTLDVAAHVLKKHGARRVGALVLARNTP